MEATVGVYKTHDEALKAVEQLKNAGFPAKQVSIIGQANIVDDHMHVRSPNELMSDPMVKVGAAGLGVGAVVGPALGLLAGAGIFMIPGFGFLYGVGAVVGALAGLDIGIISGGLFNIFATLGVKNDQAAALYESHLKEGKYLVVAHGDNAAIKKAEDILQKHGQHIELNTH